jgi:hypothetical protein
MCRVSMSKTEKCRLAGVQQKIVQQTSASVNARKIDQEKGRNTVEIMSLQSDKTQ